MKNIKAENILIPFGMIGVISYLGHTLFGDYLLESHNPITMQIENLIKTDTPYSAILLTLVIIFSISMILFAIGMSILAKKDYSNRIKNIYLALFIPMQIAFFINSIFDNKIYTILAVFIILSSIFFAFSVAFEYLKHDIFNSFGKIILFLSTLLLIFGIYYAITLVFNLTNIGLAQRLFVFSFMGTIFVLSNHETFFDKEANAELYKKMSTSD